MKRLEGKVALVTGAGGGIGAATAQRLAIEGAQIGVIDLMADGIPVNCVAPGGTATRMSAGIRAKLTGVIPLKRFAEATEIAAAHAFLVSDDASFITRQVLFVDAGASIGSTF